jgi:hypothetical protein
MDVTALAKKPMPHSEISVQLMDKKGKKQCGTLIITVRAVRGHDVMVEAAKVVAEAAAANSTPTKGRKSSTAK